MNAKNYDLVPLPAAIRSLLKQNTHPGLELDKYAATRLPANTAGKWQELVQRPTADQVCRLSQSPPPGLDWESLRERKSAVLRAIAADSFTCTTVGPLTLHLSRASALENAGICLHPLYGFVYLPGSGLKGMARAYAETVAGVSPDELAKVFGNEPGERKKEKQRSGAIVFHEAWPTAWPRLIVDIVNNHHADYYQSKPDDNKHPPGDWENPNPVYFLAVPAGTAFQFALSPRRADVPKELLTKAKEWLLGALCHLGAGAKTAAGYGSFRPDEKSPPVLSSSVRSCFEATLELVTPAFLAGANQRREDCDLRSATLRGLMRWWWRTMHAGYVDIATLRRMEAALWGDTNASGAIRLEVRPEGKIEPVPYNKQKEARQNKLPHPPNNKTTQGLWYHSFGMHDGGKQRHYLPPGCKWRLMLTVRNALFVRLDKKGKPIRATERTVPKDVVLDQALAALWWLCALGGVGSKSRKGFGNFKNPPEFGARLGNEHYGAAFLSKGKLLRKACDLPEDNFLPEQAGGGPSLRQLSNLGRRVHEGNAWIEIRVETTNVWDALNRTGMAAQRFAQDRKHRREKQGLGLPRRIGPPAQGQFSPGPEVKDRHASPIHYHLHPEGKGFVLRVAAFPAARLTNLQASEALLEKLLQHFANIGTL